MLAGSLDLVSCSQVEARQVLPTRVVNRALVRMAHRVLPQDDEKVMAIAKLMLWKGKGGTMDGHSD